MKFFVVFAVTCFIVGYVEAAKILAIFPLPSGSHYILGTSLMRALAERGHDVTFISPYALKDPPENGSFRNIVMTGMAEKMEEHRRILDLFKLASSTNFANIVSITSTMAKITEESLAHEDVQKLITSGEKFDLVIVEQLMNEAHKALAPHFGAPLALLCPLPVSHWINDFVGNPSPLSYVPEYTVDTEEPKMSFAERINNLVMFCFNLAFNHFYINPTHSRLVQKYIPNPPNLENAQYNVSLALVNGHNSLLPAVPSVPSIVYIAGYHIKPPKKLPKDLQEFLDGSPEGVLYFSMGSNLRSTELPAEKREAFLKAFAKLKQKVLWKWEDDSLPGQPPNVKMGKWFPQQDILAHPNVQLFITHGGFLSTTETVYYGVPILAIPIFADQQMNAKIAVKGGFGLIVPYGEISEEKLSQTISELLSNPKFSNNARAKSRLFHDRPMSPMDTAIFWLEYVVRNGGAPHLRVAGLDLPWYQYYLLDVAALFIGAGLVLLYVNYVIARTVMGLICRRLTKSTAGRNADKNKKTQ